MVSRGEDKYVVWPIYFDKSVSRLDGRKVSKKHDFPLIIDEIQAGMGRTGKWWAFEHYDVKPDIMTSAKALQVGAVISSEKYGPKEEGAVSSTWGGGQRIDLAIGLKTIEVIEKEDLLKNAEKRGKQIMKRLNELKSKYPKKIVDVRGLGLMCAFELKKEKNKNIFIQKAFKEGLLLLGCGTKTIRVIPPLIITREEVEMGLNIIEKVVRKIKA